MLHSLSANKGSIKMCIYSFQYKIEKKAESEEEEEDEDDLMMTSKKKAEDADPITRKFHFRLQQRSGKVPLFTISRLRV